MAGYSGYSKSNNAIIAEKEGKFPITKAKKIVAERYNLSLNLAKKILEEIGYCEWHHTSKKYNRTYYYDTNDPEIKEKINEFKQELKQKQRKIKSGINPFTGKKCKHPVKWRASWGCPICGEKYS